jgi:phenylalanine-4-hydroxylase
VFSHSPLCPPSMEQHLAPPIFSPIALLSHPDLPSSSTLPPSCSGEPIPRVNYTPEETVVWSTVLRQLSALHPRLACSHFLNAAPLFSFAHDAVPQLQDLSAVLSSHTGWRVRPVAGLLHPRDFLAGLAFRTFHSTQFLRHPSSPGYTPEPDLIHEAIGHVPLLANPAFSDLVQAIGLASLAADDAQIWHLTKCYWYTVEFGVVMEGGKPKAFGAGLLSSYAEMENLAAGKAELLRFDPFSKLPPISYKDGCQGRYYYLESFEAGAARLQSYCDHLQARLPDEAKNQILTVSTGALLGGRGGRAQAHFA